MWQGTQKVALVVGFVVAIAQAGPLGPAYPPPNGVSVSASGHQGRAGGFTWMFSGVNLAGLNSLYWGPKEPIREALDGMTDAAGETLTLTSFNATTAVWQGASTIHLAPTYGGPRAVDTRFTLRVSGAASLMSVGSVGITNGNGVVARVTGNFAANLLFEARFAGTGSFMPVLDFVDSQQHTVPPTSPNGVITHFNGGFWWTIATDLDQDGDVDLSDFAVFQTCFNGPNAPPSPGCAVDSDFDNDGDVDLSDFAAFQVCFNGPNAPPACP